MGTEDYSLGFVLVREDLAAMSKPMRHNAEDELVQALVNYRSHYSQSIAAAPDNEAQKAKQLLERARYLVRDSGLSRALVTVLFGEIKYWPSWSRNPAFQNYQHFDAKEVVADKNKDDRGKDNTWISFAYKDRWYGVLFIDDGWSSYGDAFHHGKVEFYNGGELVLGLDISEEVGADYHAWKEFNLYAFRAGDWCRALLEISADIEMGIQQKRSASNDADTLRRAANISL